jgi:cyclic pyranopterin phosphate synthase
MPEDVTFLDRHELLSFEEITRFVRAGQRLGINKVRLTGGEPLLRRDLPELVRMLLAIEAIQDLGLTTNGLLLSGQAQALHDAGLQRLNVSLDTLDPQRFRQLARRDGLELVIKGIEAAKQAGFSRIKVNAVVIRGVNEMDVVPLACFAREHDLEMRFIEYMPIGAESWERDKCYFAHEILEQLETAFGPLLPAHDYDPRNPAMEYVYEDEGGRVGMIASISRPFCRQCNRIRLTADGKLRNCLFALEEDDVKSLLRAADFDEEALLAVIRKNVLKKWEGHEINTARFVKPARTMHAIGG